MADRLVWTREMKGRLASAVIDFKRSNRTGDEKRNSFKTQEWSDIIKRFNDATTDPNENIRNIPRDKFITCFSERRKEYESFKFTIELSGFGWNEEDKLITATDEKWEELKAAHPAKQHHQWQKKNYHYREEWTSIFEVHY